MTLRNNSSGFYKSNLILGIQRESNDYGIKNLLLGRKLNQISANCMTPFRFSKNLTFRLANWRSNTTL